MDEPSGSTENSEYSAEQSEMLFKSIKTNLTEITQIANEADKNLKSLQQSMAKTKNLLKILKEDDNVPNN